MFVIVIFQSFALRWMSWKEINHCVCGHQCARAEMELAASSQATEGCWSSHAKRRSARPLTAWMQSPVLSHILYKVAGRFAGRRVGAPDPVPSAREYARCKWGSLRFLGVVEIACVERDGFWEMCVECYTTAVWRRIQAKRVHFKNANKFSLWESYTKNICVVFYTFWKDWGSGNIECKLWSYFSGSMTMFRPK